MSKRDILNLLKDTLLDYGFKKTGNLFYKEIDNNTFSTFNYGVGYGQTVIFPNIGIGYVNVDKLYANLCDIKYRKCPILLNGLYDWHWKPEDREDYRKDCKKWELFIDNGRTDEILAEMFSVVFKYGEPFWKELSDFDNLFNVVSNGKKFVIYNHTKECLLPIFYYLRGEKEKGLEYIEEIKKHGGNPQVKDFTSNYNRNLSYLDFAKRYEQLP